MNDSNHTPPLGISKSAWLLMVCVVAVFVVSFMGRSWVQDLTNRPESDSSVKLSQTKYNRIVGLSPSNVETLFALGLGKKVVAVNRYTSFPAEAAELPKICGMVDVDYEQLLLLKPDGVVMLDSQNSLLEKFGDLGIPTLSVTHDTVSGIIDSFTEMAKFCGNETRASLLVEEINSHITAVKQQVVGKEKPRVLVCIHHSNDVAAPQQIVVCGSAGYHRELIEIAGGVNAYQGSVAFPKLSREKLIHLNPDIIIDLVNEKVSAGRTRESMVKQWDAYSELVAVKNKRVVIADGAEHFMPGPRFLATLDVFAEGIHGVKVSRKGTMLKAFENGEVLSDEP